jgi:predicted RNA-binding Zn-ribbon protein involved in translation (DUF1610 family)
LLNNIFNTNYHSDKMIFDEELLILRDRIAQAEDMDELNYLRITNEKKYWWTSIFIAGLFYALNGHVGKMILTWIVGFFTLGIYGLYVIYTSYRDQNEFNNQMEYYIMKRTKELNGHAPSNQGTSWGAATGSRTFACPNCGTEVEESNKFCPGCGNKVEIPEDKPRFCGNCGAEIIAGAKFCQGCGNPVGEAQSPESVEVNKKTVEVPIVDAAEEESAEAVEVPVSDDGDESAEAVEVPVVDAVEDEGSEEVAETDSDSQNDEEDKMD